MKRKIIAIVLTAFMMLGIVGCSTEGLNLYREMNKVGTWEYEETKGDVKVSVEGMGVKVNMDLEVKSYTDLKNTIAYAETKVTQVEMIDKLTNMSIQSFEMSPIKMYVDKETIYISKSYFTDLFSATGAPLPLALKNAKADYIGLDLSQAAQGELVDQKAAQQLIEKLFKGSNIKLPITQNSREYTIELNSDEIVDLTVEYLKVIISNMDEISKYASGAIKKDDLEMIKAQKSEIESSFEKGKAMIKPAIDGSKIKMKYVFADDTYSQSLDMLVKIAVGEEAGTMKMTAQSESKKAVHKAIVLPTSKVVYTMEQFMGLLIPGVPNSVEISLDKTITKNKEVYIPLKLAINQLGYPVQYNAKTKKTSIIVDGEEIVVETVVEKGTSYVALNELSKIGFTYTQDTNTIVVFK